MRSYAGAQHKRKPVSAWLGIGLIVFSMVAGWAGEVQSNGRQRSQFRFGFSSRTFSDVNESDAKAAMKVWMQMLAKERGLHVSSDPIILNGVEAISQALRGKIIDAIALPVDEYWKLHEDVDTSLFIVGLNEGRFTEDYVLLVHQDSEIKRISDLRGRSVMLWQNSRMSLALTWLDIALFNDGCWPVAEFCRVVQNKKLTKVVLPVFFRQSDACVVTRRGLKIMSELNPQVAQQLRVLASSPELVPSGFCFRRDYDDPLREIIATEMGSLTSTSSGQQVLTLFQSGPLKSLPVSYLDSARDLLATHEWLCGGTNKVNALQLSSVPVVAQGRTPQ